MPQDDALNEILIHMGETRKGVSNLETSMSGVRQELNELNQGTVKRPECTERHVVVARSINAVTEKLDDIKGDVMAIRRNTGKEYPAITPSMLKGGDGKKGIKYWVSVGVGITTLLGFLASLVWGVISVGRYIEKVDQLTQVSKKQQSEIKKEIGEVAKAKPKIVYVKVPAKVEEKPATKRRVNRRYRRTTPRRAAGSRGATETSVP